MTLYLNPRTGATWPVDTPLWCAPDDQDYLNLTQQPTFDVDAIDTSNQSMWRYRAMIPVAPDGIVSLGEGNTPLVDDTWDGMPVSCKLEYFSPTGSFKDRGVSALMTYLHQRGLNSIVEDSSGNAGSAMAAYAARAGMACTVFSPAHAPEPKLSQMRAMGADVRLVEGTRDEVASQALQAASEGFYAGHAWHPYFLEGTKTVAFELWEQLGRRAPSAVVMPVGQGGNLLGCWLGFGALLSAGLIERLPRLYGIQAEASAPAVWLFRGEEAKEVRPTIADGIASGHMVRLAEAVSAMRESGGRALAVTEAQIVRAMGDLHRRGFFVEPTCATVLAGMRRLVTDGDVNRDEAVVAILTGTGLKAIDRIASM